MRFGAHLYDRGLGCGGVIRGLRSSSSRAAFRTVVLRYGAGRWRRWRFEDLRLPTGPCSRSLDGVASRGRASEVTTTTGEQGWRQPPCRYDRGSAGEPDEAAASEV